MALYFVASGIFFVTALIIVIALPRRRRLTHVDLTPSPTGRLAIQQALEGFAIDHNLQVSVSRVDPGSQALDVGSRLNELRDSVGVLAQKQLSEADVYLIVVKTMAMIVGLVAGVLAGVGLIVNLLS